MFRFITWNNANEGKRTVEKRKVIRQRAREKNTTAKIRKMKLFQGAAIHFFHVSEWGFFLVINALFCARVLKTLAAFFFVELLLIIACRRKEEKNPTICCEFTICDVLDDVGHCRRNQIVEKKSVNWFQRPHQT